MKHVLSDSKESAVMHINSSYDCGLFFNFTLYKEWHGDQVASQTHFKSKQLLL